jgi:hypothetical protein
MEGGGVKETDRETSEGWSEPSRAIQNGATSV